MVLLQVKEVVTGGREIASGQYNPNWLIVVILLTICVILCIAVVYLYKQNQNAQVGNLTLARLETKIEAVIEEHKDMLEKVTRHEYTLYPPKRPD